MPHSVSNSNTFLSYFNQMDDFFTELLHLSGHMPFSEKVEMVAQGSYTVSSFVKKYASKLKYFADMRNQLVHGFRLDHEHYLIASDHAVNAIHSLSEHLISPPCVGDICFCAVPVLDTQMTFEQCATYMVESKLFMLPFYEGGMYLCTISIQTVLGAIVEGEGSKQLFHGPMSGSASVAFIAPERSIYGIDDLFLTASKHEKPLVGIWISEDGTDATPIVGKIDAQDLPKLHQLSILTV